MNLKVKDNGDWIREMVIARAAELGMSAYAVSRAINVTGTTMCHVYHYMKGRRSITSRNLQHILSALGLTLSAKEQPDANVVHTSASLDPEVVASLKHGYGVDVIPDQTPSTVTDGEAPLKYSVDREQPGIQAPDLDWVPGVLDEMPDKPNTKSGAVGVATPV